MNPVVRCLVVLGLLAGVVGARADVTLPALFSDHMVLQQGCPVALWGWADPGEKVTVSLDGQTVTAVAGKDGLWRAELKALRPGESRTLTVAGKNTQTVKDVLVGEVWLASGQSNMAMTVNRARDFEKEKEAAKFPQMRMFTVASGPAKTPQKDCKGQWVVCSPETVGTFSATAYFFGRDVHQTLKVPVGIINSSVGGTAIEAWTSMDVQRDKKDLAPMFADWDQRAKAYDPDRAKANHEKQLAAWKEAAAKAKTEGKPAPRRPQVPVHPREDRNHPANLFNGKIAPLIPYTLKGAIWYQGENNARGDDRAERYRLQLPLLIEDWRTRWGQGAFPFAWVQLPNFQSPQGTNWPVIREAMLESLSLPNTGMAITIDIGDPKDIHPTNKQDVGKRLAMWALARVYDRKGPSSGPLLQSHSIADGSVTLKFSHADEGLKVRGDELKGFEIAGADQEWHPATAKIAGSDTVSVFSPKVPKPAAVRYLWASNPEATLFNGAGLPASPFRTSRSNPKEQSK